MQEKWRSYSSLGWTEPIVGPTSYEATIVYLVRRKKKLEMDIDKHTIGLFDSATWNRLLLKKGFRVKKKDLKDSYSRFMIEKGEYPQVMLVCQKIREKEPRREA